jgi:hypothetical protein
MQTRAAARGLHDRPRPLAAAAGPRGGSLRLGGHTKLTELITNKYALDEINEGHQDLMDGKNIRGVIVHSIRASVRASGTEERSE